MLLSKGRIDGCGCNKFVNVFTFEMCVNERPG